MDPTEYKAVVEQAQKLETLLIQMTLEEEAKLFPKSTAATVSPTLFDAVERGDNNDLFNTIVKLELDEEKEFNQIPLRNDCGETLLHVAAKSGHWKTAFMLLCFEVDVNCQDFRKRTPLHCAVAQGHLDFAWNLLNSDAKVNVKDADDVTPLGIAAEKGKICFVRTLLSYGARPDEKEILMAAENGHWKIVDWMLLRGGIISAFWRGKEKYPLVALACKENQWGIAKRLLMKGASASHCKTDRESALVWASQAGQADVVHLLLHHGAASHPEQIRWALKAACGPDVVRAFAAVVPHLIRGELEELGLSFPDLLMP